MVSALKGEVFQIIMSCVAVPIRLVTTKDFIVGHSPYSTCVDLNSAIAPQDHRVLALQTAISEFDHDQDFKHDEELDLHADKILFQKLAFAFQVDRSSEEVAMICTALEMVYRASRPRVALSFAELRESVLPMFVEMLGKPLHLRKQEELDIALTEQEEKLNTSREFSYRSGHSGAYQSSDESRRSGSYQSGHSLGKPTDQSRSASVEEMSLQSAGKDDPTYQSYQGDPGPQKQEPDDQSYLSYDDNSLGKPGKQLDEQSYQSYDQSRGGYESQPYQPTDQQTYVSSGQASRDTDQKSVRSKNPDDQTYQTYDRSRGPDDQTYQSYDRPHQPTQFQDDGTFQTYGDATHQTQDKSLSKAASVYDDQSYSSYDQSVKKGEYRDAASYDKSRGEGIYQDAQSYDENTYQEDQSRAGQSRYDGQSYGGEGQTQSQFDGQSYGGGTLPEGQSPSQFDGQSYGEGAFPEGHSQAGQSHQDGQSYGEGTFQEGRSQGSRSYGDGTYQEGQSHGDQSHGDGTYRDGHSQVQTNNEERHSDGNNGALDAYEETGGCENDGAVDKGDDLTYDGESTIRTEDRSIAQETQYTEEGYHSEEQSLQPTMYSERDQKYRDDESKADQTFTSYAEQSLQPTTYAKHAYGKNAQSDDQSYQQEDTTLYTQDQSYMGDEESYKQSDFKDDVSAFTEDLQSRADYSVQKPGKETYEVETVYSEDQEDEQSRNPTLQSTTTKGTPISSNQSHQNPRSGMGMGMGLQGMSSGLSTVAEESHEDSSMGASQQSSWNKSRESSHSQPSQPSFLPSIAESGTMRSTRSTASSSSAARALKERKVEQERQMSEQVARLEAELEVIRVEDATNSVGVSRSLQVLRYFSRVLSAMVPMAHHPGLLNALVYQLERQPYGRHAQHFNEYDDGEPRSEEDKDELAAARVDAIATIVNLACAEENKAKMAAHQCLLDSITTVARNDPSEEAREHASIVLMNLAYEDENKELMVQHPHMLETLVKLIQDNSPFTRRYASAAMFTLACVVGNTEKMAIYCDGEILECLRRVLADDPVDEARINAGEALFNMSRNNTEETLQTMGDHPRLLATLAKAVLTDYSADVRVFCARALEWMSAGIHFPMDCHRLLLSALTVSAQWTKTSCIAEAMKTQATLVENRLPMAGHDGLLQALSNLAMLESLTDTDVRKSAIAALEMISRDDRARPFMVRNEQVMRALTKASFEHGDDEVYGEDDQGAAVTTKLLKRALKNLSGEM